MKPDMLVDDYNATWGKIKTDIDNGGPLPQPLLEYLDSYCMPSTPADFDGRVSPGRRDAALSGFAI